MRWLMAACLLVLPMQGQMVGIPAAKGHSFVVYDAEPQEVSAGRRGVLELRFRVAEGFHVNSHVPKSELLIPTEVLLRAADGVKAAAAEYPVGTAYALSVDPATPLDVYTGAFTVRVPVVAAAGEHTLEGLLRYQACDRAACYPAKSLPVAVSFRAK